MATLCEPLPWQPRAVSFDPLLPLPGSYPLLLPFSNFTEAFASFLNQVHCVTDLKELLRSWAIFSSTCGCIRDASQVNTLLPIPDMQIALNIF